MGVKVVSTQRIEVDGQPVTPAGLVYVLLNKPKDTITTASDEKGPRTVLDLVELEGTEGEALFPVGRLDRDTTGALLLTTDGDLAHRLMHPRYGAPKLYLVQTAQPVTGDQIDAIREGVTLEDGPASADQAGYVDAKDKTRVALALHEGRNRQVRRMFEALGHEVTGLDRVGYAGLDLQGLRRGRWRRLEPHEINALRRSVKLKSIVF
jgi:23S rRNA pseudouridine2605 synthase